MSRKKLFLLDAMALLYRAHFAFIRNPRLTSKGVDTSAVFGFVNTLLEIIAKEKPTHLAVVADTSAPTFRHIAYPEYKAQREAMPEALQNAIELTWKLLDAMNIPVLKMDGYEADDIIGTLATRLSKEGFDVYMVTSDKDYAQLVREHVYLYRPQHKGGGFDVLDPQKVVEKFGIPPERIVDFLGLKGDSVDNIPGIPKIGDKTAVSLINEFGTVENIIEHVDEISRKSIQQTVREHAQQGLMSKELATIKTDVPIEVDLEQMEVSHVNLEAMMPILAELEFKTTTQRILNSVLNPMAQPTDLFGGTYSEGEPSVGVQLGEVNSINDSEHDYRLLDSAEKRAELIARIEEAGLVCFDTETTGLDPMQAELVGMSFSLKAGEAFFVYLPEAREETLAILEEFTEVLQSKSIKKIGQNLKYDLLMLRNYGIRVEGPMFDTMLAHYVLDPGGKHGMDAMAREFLNYEPVSIESLIGKKGKKQKSMREVELDLLSRYAAEDADITFRLYEILAPKVAGNKVFEEIEQPLMPILADMEYQGIRIDTQALEAYSKELDERMAKLEQRIYELAGETFNINSPRQLGDILFDKLELGKGNKAKKTKTGQYSTNEQVLQALAVQHELPALVLAFRGLKKLQSTYVDALPKMVNPKTGRVHTTFSQSVAVTGRLASVNPNLQNIPIRTADGREVRKGFIPRDEHHLLMSADYSQVELRIMAAMSKDENMLTAFMEQHDIHRATAARVFGVPPEEVTPEQRSRAKTVNFGIIYGISAFGLSQRMGISRTEAKSIIDAYFKTYPRVKAFMDECIAFAKEHGYVETLFGRRRYLPDIHSRNATVRSFAERNAINSPIQGTAADIIKLAMIDVFQAIEAEGLRSKMILQVHDELVFDAHKEEIEQMKQLVQDKMVHAVDIGVPMEVEIGVGNNWLEAH
ncbi:MAG: DNA polymerase I [Bacteroidetes bacterium]|nr:MAG: DNA polymerase I [Bacteroidota bacterium]